MHLAHRMLCSLSLLFCCQSAAAQIQTESYKLVAPGGMAGDRFGYSVALSETMILVGAPGRDFNAVDDGIAFLFDRATGQFLRELRPRGVTDARFFGAAVAVEGNFALVTTVQESSNPVTPGSLFVFDASTGQELWRLWSSDPQSFDGFGESVAIDGSTAVVGAWAADAVEIGTGAAFVFGLNNGSLLYKLWAYHGRIGDRFGGDVDIDGSRILVGARGHAALGTSGGAAFLFDSQTGQELGTLQGADTDSGDRFGDSVSLDMATLSGGVALLSASGSEGGVGLGPGLAYSFQVNYQRELQRMLPESLSSNFEYGGEVAVSGDLAAVGAVWTGTSPSQSGRIFVSSAGRGEILARLRISDPLPDHDRFGTVFDIEGRLLVAGAEDDDDLGASAGAVYVFEIPEFSHNGSQYCAGLDWSCPCGAGGGNGGGCANGSGVGAILEGLGNAEISNDTFSMRVTQVNGDRLGLLLRGSAQFPLGLGNQVGDGLLCTTGQVLRSQIVSTSGGVADFTDFRGEPFGATVFLPGDELNYQFWYRDPTNTCTGAGFNFSNAWTVHWGV